MDNDWNKVRHELDKSDNFEAICNSPWYSDTVYNKFSDEEFARRHQVARKLMTREGLDALILTGGPDIYSHGSGVTWGAGLIDDRGMCRLRALGHSLPQRSPLLPDMPAIAESVPGFKYVAFSGFLAPKGVPKPVLQKINATMEKVVSTPEMREQLAFQGAEPATGTSAEFRKAVEDELIETSKLVKAIGLKSD
jgi:hypothetical protein